MNHHLAKQADLPTVRRHLRMAYVLEQYGHYPDHSKDGKLHYHSPFREDANPSFDVFMHQIAKRPEPEERYGDFADPDLKQGDVIDLIQKFESCSTSLALAKARDMLASQLESGWTGPTVSQSEYRVLDMEDVQDFIDRRRSLGLSSWWNGLPRTHPGLAGLVPPSDRMFLHPDHDVVVFLLCDDTGEIRGVRQRDSEGRKFSLSGSQNILMRMEAPSDKPVFLCEGETDTWAAWNALREDYEVIGVPGVSNHPEKAGALSLAGRVVYIVFDPDEAGQAGRTAWAEYLASIGCDVRTVVLPEDRDVAKLDVEIIRRLPSRARTLPPAPQKFIRQGDTFVTVTMVGKGDNQTEAYDAKSNWSFVPTKILVGDDGTRAYQGTLLPHNRVVTLPDSALTGSSPLKNWGRQYQARWFGSDPQVQQLAALIDHEAAYLPEGLQHDQVGLYEGSFVWPGGFIGDQAVEFVPGVAEIKLDSGQIFVKEDPGTDPVSCFRRMYACQNASVTGPILAWLAAAPLRTRFRQFPILNISGISGSGKSALTEELLRVFSSTHLATTLSSTTPYAVQAQINNSCGFPVWFDEYRPGAKETAKDALDQLMRDAYTMQESAKGGQDRANLSRLSYIRTAAPIVVSGEDSFTETSHTDRMVLVRLIRDEQGDLSALQRGTEGFAHQYLTYLTRPSNYGIDDTIPVFDTFGGRYEVEGLSDRQCANLAVLVAGWELLEGFLTSVDPGFEMPPLQLDRVIDAARHAGESNPIEDLMQICLENDTHDHCVWRWNGFLCVHPANLVKEARNHPSIILPVANAAGVRDFLRDKFGVGEAVPTVTPASKYAPSNRIRAIRIPESALPWLMTADDEGITYDDNSPSL